MRGKSLIYLMAWFCLVAACAYMSPYFSNDYRYMLVQGGEGMVGSLGDIVISQWNHYFMWGGRTVAHTIAQTLLYIGKPWSALMGALCYLTLVLTIYAHALGRVPSWRELRLPPLFMITLMLWLCLRVFGEVTFMLVSSCNYLYTTTLVMIFLLPLRMSLNPDAKEHGALFGMGMFALGILAGWTNENTGFAACLGTGAIGWWLLRTRRLRLWHVMAGAGLGIGYLLLMLSPGNAARLEFMEENGYTFLGHLSKALGIYFITLATQLPILLSALFMGVRLYRAGAHRKAPSLWYGALWEMLVAFLALTVMLGSPNFPGRSAAPFTFFAIASMTGMYALAESTGTALLPRAARNLLCALGVAFMIPTMGNTLLAYHQAMEDGHARDLEIASKIASGERDLVVAPFHVQTSKYVFIGDVRAQKIYFANGILKNFYHVNSLRRRCNFAVPKLYDFMYLQDFGDEVCTGDRGDPLDPADAMNRAYLLDHPDEIAHLKFPKKGGYTKEMFVADMTALGLENADGYLKP